MPTSKMLPQQQQHPPDIIHADAPNEATVFGITELGFNSFDELIQTSARELGVEYELFISNLHGTQHGYMRIKDGKILQTIPLVEFSVLSAEVVNKEGSKIGYRIQHFKNTMSTIKDEFIPIEYFENNKVYRHLKLPPQGNRKKGDLCERLVQTMIIEKSEETSSRPIEICSTHGWNFYLPNYARWETKGRYPPILRPIMSDSLLCREKAVKKNGIFKTKQELEWNFKEVFSINPDLKVYFLIRTASYMLSFAAKYSIFFDQIIGIRLTDRAVIALLIAMFDNVTYGRGSVQLLSQSKGIDEAAEKLNDAVHLVVDDTKPDEVKRREAGVDVLHGIAIDSRTKYHQLPVVLSNYAASQMRTDLCIDVSMLKCRFNISPAVLAEILEWHDADMIEKIEAHFSEFIEIIDSIFEDISMEKPLSIPPQRRNIYYILIATLRAYDEYFGEFFGDETEQHIIALLSDYNEVGSSNEELLLTLFGNSINEEINEGRFNYIKRTKYIVFNPGNNSVIVDDDFIYIETEVVQELARRKMKLHSVNSLTDALKANDCLTINDKNSKCYRFHVQNSDGEPYMLYTYGISKKLINAENRRKLDLADYQKYLLKYCEMAQNELLPLGITADGRYVCKDISFGNKSNDHILITGQSGKGKSFCATNLLPLLAMLGSRMLVCDVSDSFTRNEVLRALPTDVVDALFEFIEVAAGKRKLPINPLFIGDCPGLPAKKRRIVGFIKAIAGKLDKEETRELTGIVSEMLKRYPKESSVTTDMIRNTLKRGGKTGRHVFSLVSSTLDDIDNIGFEEQGWAEFFEKTKKIPVLSFGNESGDKVHSLLDALISSAFEWQRDHDTAPLTVVVDEIKDQNFTEGSPLHTILTQGRKFNTKFIGMTQQYISNSSHAIDVVKEAGIKIFFKPAKSLDRIAAELGYKNPVDAGFGSMGIGDIILSAELFNKVDGVNEPVVIHAKAIKFVDTQLYEKFRKEYNIKIS